MKNIHILSTDNYKNAKIFQFGVKNGRFVRWYRAMTEPRNIYLTSDEEIKEGGYVLVIGENLILGKKGDIIKINSSKEYRTEYTRIDGSRGWFASDANYNRKWNYRKIILTTDQDLIKDGVQAIDDEFLEWFVKNPSCDKVEVNKECNYGECNCNMGICKEHEKTYKIIIPKEEPKQIKCYCGHTTYCDCGPLEEPKQETLEEVRVVKRTELYNSILSIVKQIPRKEVECDAMDAPSCAYELEQLFYKWQQERSYSEEELHEIFYAGFDYAEDKSGNVPNFKQWFEQFKKK